MDIHKALSSPIRKQIITSLSSSPRYLSQLSSEINRKPQTIDFHMKLLQQAGLVRSEWKQGRKYFILEKSAPVQERKPHTPQTSVYELLRRMDEIEAKLNLLLKKQTLEHLY